MNMKVRIYALTDSHQESRNLSKLLSGIYDYEKNSNEEFLVLDCGDLFKGIYDKDLSVNAYLKIKELCPKAQIFFTLGNNDFGFNQESFKYFQNLVEKFDNAGINFVCANLKNNNGEYSNLIPRYKILNINGKKILITGFCLNTSVVKRFGYEFEEAKNCLKNLIKSIKEDYDHIVILNHHWYPYSKDLKDFATKNGINIDLIIGGHEHSKIEPDFENNIFYPLAFARTLYKITLGDKISDVKEINLNEIHFIKEFEKPIEEYEKETKLFEPIAKRVLNLYKWYSEPCALGTFISDNMKKIGNTDIAFHSTGFTMYPLKTGESDVITKYDFEKVICAPTTLVKIDINTEQLKKVFENATINRMKKNNGNARFLQCSQNISITGQGDNLNKTYKIIQIEINGENLLDENQKPINPNKKFSCTIDAFIGAGEQGFEVLKNIPKTPILANKKEVQINTLLFNALQEAQHIYPQNSEYPVFKLRDI